MNSLVNGLANGWVALAAKRARRPVFVTFSALQQLLAGQKRRWQALERLGNRTARETLKRGELYVTTKTISRYLNIPERTVRHYAKKRVITSYGIPGGLLRFKMSEVEADMQKLRRASKWVH